MPTPYGGRSGYTNGRSDRETRLRSSALLDALLFGVGGSEGPKEPLSNSESSKVVLDGESPLLGVAEDNDNSLSRW